MICVPQIVLQQRPIMTFKKLQTIVIGFYVRVYHGIFLDLKRRHFPNIWISDSPLTIIMEQKLFHGEKKLKTNLFNFRIFERVNDSRIIGGIRII